MLVDQDLQLATSYGAVKDQPNRIKRSTFVIGPDGKIEHSFYGVSAKGHVENVLQSLTG